jgi:hypothetical protein
MFEVVAKVFRQNMTEFSGAESEEGKIWAITEIVLKLVKQDACIQMTCTAGYDRDKLQTHPLDMVAASSRQTRNCLIVINIFRFQQRLVMITLQILGYFENYNQFSPKILFVFVSQRRGAPTLWKSVS